LRLDIASSALRLLACITGPHFFSACAEKQSAMAKALPRPRREDLSSPHGNNPLDRAAGSWWRQASPSRASFCSDVLERFKQRVPLRCQPLLDIAIDGL